jgi:hypothetical protein
LEELESALRRRPDRIFAVTIAGRDELPAAILEQILGQDAPEEPTPQS